MVATRASEGDVSFFAGFIVCALSAVVLFHLYWAFGGRFFADAVIPARKTSHGPEKIFNPSPLAALIVAAYLAAIIALAFAVSRGEAIIVSADALRGLLGIAGGVFLLRAVGDFRYVGLFKRVRGTRFAFWDTLLFSPFVFLVGAACVAVAIG
jgi:hypothetical protein